jgi:hypothetical protein
MTQLILSAEQVRVIFGASETIELCDEHGKLLGYVVRPPSGKEVIEARRRLASDGPWHTTEEVLKHLNSLEQG